MMKSLIRQNKWLSKFAEAILFVQLFKSCDDFAFPNNFSFESMLMSLTIVSIVLRDARLSIRSLIALIVCFCISLHELKKSRSF